MQTEYPDSFLLYVDAYNITLCDKNSLYCNYLDWLGWANSVVP